MTVRTSKMLHIPRTTRRACRLGMLLLCAAAACGPAQADAVSDFYSGKTFSLIAGFPPGGGYDTYVRVLARHYGRFLPGQPNVVASNMPGAGSLDRRQQYLRQGSLRTASRIGHVRVVGGDGAAARQQGRGVRRHEIQLDRKHVAGRRLLRGLAAAGRRRDLRRDDDEGDDLRRRRARRPSPSSIRWCSRTC